MESKLSRPSAEQWYEQCGKKKRYSSETLAQKVADRRMEVDRRMGSEELTWDLRLRVYKCHMCMGFHITSKPHSKRWPSDDNGSQGSVSVF